MRHKFKICETKLKLVYHCKNSTNITTGSLKLNAFYYHTAA